MRAVCAQEPVPVSPGLHDHEVVTFHAIRTLDDLRRIGLTGRAHCTVTCAVLVTDPRVAVMVDTPVAEPDTSPV